MEQNMQEIFQLVKEDIDKNGITENSIKLMSMLIAYVEKSKFIETAKEMVTNNEFFKYSVQILSGFEENSNALTTLFVEQSNLIEKTLKYIKEELVTEHICKSACPPSSEDK